MSAEIKKSVQELLEISHYVGANQAYAQGGGGNTSVKIDNSKMLIKASGIELRNMSEQQGFALVDFQAVKQQLNNIRDENHITEIFAAATIPHLPKAERPSIETGLHALIDKKYVIHCHSVYANILTCSEAGKNLASEIFAEGSSADNFLWVNYLNPGYELMTGFARQLEELRSEAQPNLIFLQNHGLIVAGNNCQQVIDLHKEVNQKIIKYFALDNQLFSENIPLIELNFLRKNILFPDQVVYTISDELIRSKAAEQTILAYSYIYNNIIKSGLKPLFISDKNVQIISNMESEKYRKKLIKNS